ncbi:MAG: MarR family transcriptional regulator [Silicimonas sp.]|nr:MarR family transcriptional regulator [Silicimonas sp.]
MQDNSPFHLQDFMPYLLNRAAESTSLEFQKAYKGKYGMLRTEWRVLFHLGRYGSLTAKDICTRASIHKTKVSRAVSALEARRFVVREEMETDRRHALLSLTKAGHAAFDDLIKDAARYNATLMDRFTAEEADTLRRALIKLSTEN